MILYTDGASRGNPGEAGIGFLLKNKNIPLFTGSYYIGKRTNNFAEATAILVALYSLEKKNLIPKNLFLHSDSLLLVNQFNSIFKTKNKALATAHTIFKSHFSKYSVYLSHIPRNLNKEADRLANEGIEKRIPLTPDIAVFLEELLSQ
jgi:ribonuclease HI